MAQHHPTWSFKIPRSAALEGAARSITLYYEAAGLRSGWAVMVDGRTVATCPDLVTAQERALRLAQQTPTQKAA
ncbi:hypothetical protein [Azospirillum sp. sgz302134]